MLKDTALAEKYESRNTRIVTASGTSGQISGRYGVLQRLFFPTGGIELKSGKEGKAVFSEQLEDNLASVSRLCECGFVVIFEEGVYRIFRADGFSVRGELVQPS